MQIQVISFTFTGRYISSFHNQLFYFGYKVNLITICITSISSCGKISAVSVCSLVKRKESSEVLTAVKMSMIVFWVLMPCGLTGTHSSVRKYCLHLQVYASEMLVSPYKFTLRYNPEDQTRNETVKSKKIILHLLLRREACM